LGIGWLVAVSSPAGSARTSNAAWVSKLPKTVETKYRFGVAELEIDRHLVKTSSACKCNPAGFFQSCRFISSNFDHFLVTATLKKIMLKFRGLALCVISFSLFFGLSIDSRAQDWPHWRGPNRNDISPETGLLATWPEGGPTRIWLNQNAGKGYAGLAVVNGRLYTMGLAEKSEFALCLDALTGEEIWRRPLGASFTDSYGDGPRSTPSIDGNRAYLMTSIGALACLNLDDGEVLWQIKMRDFGGTIPQWGYAESPLVDGDFVVSTPGGPQGTMLALNKMTGEKVWQTEPVTVTLDETTSPPAKAHYSSILPITWNEERQFVQLTELAVIGVGAKDGKILWKSEWPGRIAVIPSPIFDRDQVYVTSGYGIGSKLIQLQPDNSVSELWFTRAMMNHHGSVVLLNDCFYGSSERGFVCQDRETGKAKWGVRSIGKGALIHADGLFYHVQEDDGKVLLFAVNDQGVSLKGSFVLKPQSEDRKRGKVWVHPIIANGRLYLRDQQYIYCFDIRSNQ
jgi:outer membrane protein assembly factor BamB